MIFDKDCKYCLMMNFILFDVWGVEKIIIYTYIYIYVYKLFYIIDIFYLIKNTTFDLKRWALEGGANIYIYSAFCVYSRVESF